MAKQKAKKIGRNAPCPCGSGKKYKKCCLEKDKEQESSALQQQAAQQLAQRNWNSFGEPPDPEDLELFEDDPTATPRYDFGEDSEEYDEDWSEDENFEDPPPERLERWESPDIKLIPRDKTPLSEAEIPAIDAWWNGLEKLKDLDDIRRYFEDLFTKQPELAQKTDWPDGMFEVGDRYRKQGREAEYIDFLMRIRREWSEFYLPDYGYFDHDIIMYLVIADRQDEVPEFLNLFREYPSHDPDNLFATIRYLTLNDCEDMLIPFVRDICHEICYSPNVIGGTEILRPVTMSYWMPYLRPDVSDTELAELMQTVKGPVNQNYFTPEFLKEQIGCIVGEFSAWDIADCPTIQDVYKRYYRICQNFMGFLHREKGTGWLMADFLRELLFQYFERVIPKGNRPREAFGVFTKNKIERTVIKFGNDMMFLYPSQLFGSLNAVYYFAEYLGVTASISGERAEEIQEWCRELFTEAYPEVERSHHAAQAFKQFPL